MTDRKNRIRGSLIGGAAGDALGYAVEFMNEGSIFSKYGPNGITEYEEEYATAVISDDTQMTLFTAQAVLDSEKDPQTEAAKEYQYWLCTQTESYDRYHMRNPEEEHPLMKRKELFARRAPGITCLNALESRIDKKPRRDYLTVKLNNSKGCGGIMRVSPAALGYKGDIRMIDMYGAQLAAVTHSHPLGYIPAAALVHIISRIIFPEKEMTLEEIVEEALDTVRGLFPKCEDMGYFTELIRKAVSLSKNDRDDLENIHELGEGWVAEETLAIAVYCSLKYRDDFSKALIAAVNHKGDSDSTGAVTGNIVGACVGLEAISDKWIEDLELKNVLLQYADLLYEKNGDDEE
ncbi:MAG: ADP-ribosylglycohydrolase family protein [Solobacterium sp.]|nr:ADP-ribosylglycohydrolase family protein [Solobacterium sp.]